MEEERHFHCVEAVELMGTSLIGCWLGEVAEATTFAYIRVGVSFGVPGSYRSTAWINPGSAKLSHMEKAKGQERAFHISF